MKDRYGALWPRPRSSSSMAGCVYDWRGGDLPSCGSWGMPCPTDVTGSHSLQAMGETLVAEFIGNASREVAIDGLAPEGIRHIKAHSVAWWANSNWDIHQRDCALAGDTRSYGGVLFEIITGPRTSVGSSGSSSRSVAKIPGRTSSSPTWSATPSGPNSSMTATWSLTCPSLPRSSSGPTPTTWRRM
jgi:hypothetical protein